VLAALRDHAGTAQCKQGIKHHEQTQPNPWPDILDIGQLFDPVPNLLAVRHLGETRRTIVQHA
jgi:hypothetical protein